MKNKFVNLFILIFCFLFLNFPISYSITNIKYIFIFIGIIALIIWLSETMKGKKELNILNEKNLLLIIIILSVITRIGIVLILNSKITQIYDFGIALNTAYTGDITDIYHSMYSHWDLYPLIIHIFCKIFGNYQIVALLFNSVISILTCVMIFLVSNKIFKEKTYGFVASIIYIIWPANILYTLILTQEHICILLLLTSVYLFLNSEKYIKERYKSALIRYALLGIVLGFSVFFKNFAYVLFIAFAMYHIAFGIVKKETIKILIKKAPLYIVMILVFLIVQNFTYAVLDNIAGRHVSIDVLSYTLHIGLRDDGVLNSENSYRYNSLVVENNFDLDKTNETIMAELIEHIKQSDSEVHSYSFWDNKAKIIFNGDSGRMYFIENSIREDMKLVNIVENYLDPLNNIFFSIMVSLMAISTIWTLYNKNLKFILIMLIVHGSSLILMLVEAQNRYKYPMYAFMCIISAVGLIQLIRKIKEKNTKINNEII